LRDAQLWGEMWRAAIDFLSENPHTAHDGEGLGRDEAEAITARWTAATRDYRDWLHLIQLDRLGAMFKKWTDQLVKEPAPEVVAAAKLSARKAAS
jgi:hypothetical protein